jgi:hypothetical protein
METAASRRRLKTRKKPPINKKSLKTLNYNDDDYTPSPYPCTHTQNKA